RRATSRIMFIFGFNDQLAGYFLDGHWRLTPSLRYRRPQSTDAKLEHRDGRFGWRDCWHGHPLRRGDRTAPATDRQAQPGRGSVSEKERVVTSFRVIRP